MDECKPLLTDIEEEHHDIHRRSTTASTVLSHLRGEETELKARLQGIMKELEVVRGRGLHSFPFPLNFSLHRPYPLNFCSLVLCPPYNPNQLAEVSQRCSNLALT